MTKTRRFGIFVLAIGLFAGACSDGGDTADAESDTTEEATETTEAAPTTVATTTTTTAEETTEAPTETTAAPADPAPAGDATAVGLGEWFVDTPATLEAGTITFAVSNTGENPHAFAIVRGTSYEELPLLDNGAVDTEMLGDDFLGKTENIPSGESGEIEFELEAGDYVFFCPVQFGPNSHAAAGQVLSVTVG